MTAQLGDRVMASGYGTGKPREGTVTVVLDGREDGYGVRFDGAEGHTMPCTVLYVIGKAAA